MILKCTLGEHFAGIDRYAIRAKYARLLASNFGGDTIAERMREATALRSSRPNLKKVVGHIILAHDPELTDLTDEQWLVALEIAKQEHDLHDAAFCAVLHEEKEHRHMHLYYVRCRPDGSVVSDSQSFRKNEAAARRIERELGLPPPTPVPKAERVGYRRASDNATRRGRRKQQTSGENFMETTELRRLAFEALASSTSTETFKRELAERGVEALWSPNHSGLSMRPTGASTSVKGSTVHRELSAKNVLAALQRNANLRQAAERASVVVVGVADDRAKNLVDARFDPNLAMDDIAAAPGVATRAQPPAEADAARAKAIAGPDPLDFLAPAEPVPLAVDDASLRVAPTDTPSVQAAGGDGKQGDDADARRDRVEAQAELSEQFKKLSAAQLIELRNAAKRPVDEAVIALAILERLLALALRLLSLGKVRIATNIAAAMQQRELVAQAADDEIARRHRSPATSGERMKWLKEFEGALAGSQNKVAAAQTVAALAKLQPATSSLRNQLVARADAVRVEVGKPTSRQLKREVAERDAAVVGLLAEAATPLARLRRLAASAEYKKRLLRAQQLYEQALAQLTHFFDSIEAEARKREAEQAARISQAQEILKDEAEALAIEIRDRVPAVRASIERDAMRERLRGVCDADDDVPRMRGD